MSLEFYRYLVKRFFTMTITLFLVTLITFSIIHVLPGSAAELILGPTAPQESVEALKQDLGLNRPLYVQYYDWITGMLTGDWGDSLRFNRSVADLILTRLPRSLILGVTATGFAILFSIPLGIIAAVNQNELPDTLASFFGYIGISIPSFMWALALIFIFGIQLRLFPTSGYVPFSEDPIAFLHHLVLPATSLGLMLTAYIMRMTRSSMLEALSEEYIRMARAKGLRRRLVILKHALRNAMIPVITVIAFQLATAFAGVIILEEVFFWPGIGQLTLRAIESRDIMVLQGCIIVIAVSYMALNFLADILYGYFDPRIRYGEVE